MITINDNKLPWKEGMTVSDALAAMKYDFAHITVTVNGKFVEPDDFDSTALPDQADMKAIHLHHGG